MNPSTYIIGEIGQNHNGSVDIAKLLIDLASRPPIDEVFGTNLAPMNAIKLTKRDLSQELSKSEMNRPYNTPNSFGETYGEHRAFLELDDDEHLDIYNYAKAKGLEFVETLCAPGTLSLLKKFVPDRLKVASRDMTNIPLLTVMAETKIPIILSTGMSGKSELDAAIKIITKYHSDVSILHCLSQYPAEHKNINLATINYLKKNYSEYTIGYSDHSIGIFVPTSAVAMGAQIIEKHITIDRDMKGTDQKGSLGPDGVRRMVRDIRLLEQSMGQEKIEINEAVKLARVKLERSIASKRAIKKGEIITENDLHLLSPGDGYKWHQKDLVIGQKTTQDIPKDSIIYKGMMI